MERVKTRFISFEGSEGCGKTTQIRLLKKRLENRGEKVVVVREPGTTKLGERLRKILKHPSFSLSPLAELFLFEASRVELIKQVIEPGMAENSWILADRFTDSTLVYQGIVRGIPLKIIEQLNALASSGIKPSLTILLDIPYQCSQLRIKKRDGSKTTTDRLQDEFENSLKQIRQAYLDLAKREPQRFYLIEGTSSPQTISARIWEKVKNVFEL
ncbi:dTMP kinase [Methylacidiphilum caldifontis]|uniref:Thymidylate kinase n=1 Tax=Methylacidiphilum caldifontis TaxID=2795386 RepID=A0A4Y8PHF9_9BACT|nr:dTMP kinase [Methylacidiphilum caldifontis]TFE72084.1 dTMP kinase [Methylacidiphilum caldifontis]